MFRGENACIGAPKHTRVPRSLSMSRDESVGDPLTDPSVKSPLKDPSSTKANYEQKQSNDFKNNLEWEGSVNCSQANMLKEFNSIQRVLKEYNFNQRNRKDIPLSMHMIRQGPGPLCCFDTQVVDLTDKNSKTTFQTVRMRPPLSLCCNGFVASIEMTKGGSQDDPDNMTSVKFETSHDWKSACCWVPYLYACTLHPFFTCMFHCMALKGNKSDKQPSCLSKTCNACCLPDCFLQCCAVTYTKSYLCCPLGCWAFRACCEPSYK